MVCRGGCGCGGCGVVGVAGGCGVVGVSGWVWRGVELGCVDCKM